MMQPQIDYQTEVHRQHVRLKIPIHVDLDGVRYQVDDWSVGGFGIESAMIAREPDERLVVRMIFPFEEFELSMRIDARVVYVDHEHGRFGCAFLTLSTDQVAVFRYLLDAYLSGEVVSAGDLLQIRALAASGEPQALPPDLDEFGWSPGRSSRSGPKLLALGLLAVALIGVIAFGLWQRLGVVTVDQAFVDAPIREIRADGQGRFLALVGRGDSVTTGDILGTLRAGSDAVEPLTSPCDCVVIDRLAADGELLRPGDPLFALVRAGETPVVRAQLALDEVERLEVGERVEIHMPGRRETTYGEIAQIDLRPPRNDTRSGHVKPPISRQHAQVIVRPDRQLKPEDVGVLARLRFL